MTSKIETVTFDISGQKYKVPRNQFDLYPDSMLAKTVSDNWLEDPSQDIFVARDGSLFRHVLSFLRDGIVFLPSSISKKELMNEFEYYGIECDNINEYIHEKPGISINMDINDYINDLKDEQQSLYENYLARKSHIDLAIYCMKSYYRGRFESWLGGQKPDEWTYDSTTKVAKWKIRKCSNMVYGNQTFFWDHVVNAYNATNKGGRIKAVNKILKDVSLKITMIDSAAEYEIEFEMMEIVD